MGRYRIRTWLRGLAPRPVAAMIPKGRHDCGRHEWYRASEITDRCYHCVVGEREHVPMPLVIGSPEWRMLSDSIERGSAEAARILASRLAETSASAEVGAREAIELIERSERLDAKAEPLDALRRLAAR